MRVINNRRHLQFMSLVQRPVLSYWEESVIKYVVRTAMHLNGPGINRASRRGMSPYLSCAVCLQYDCLFVGWLLNVPATCYRVSQGRICSDNFTPCHTEIEAADQTFHLTQSQHTDIGPTSPSTDPITPGAWQGSH